MQETALTITEQLPEQPNDVANKWELGEALKLRLKNRLTFQEIADHYGISKSTVHDRFKRLINLVDDPALNQAYSECKVEMLTAAERVLLTHMMDSDKLKDASLNNVAYTWKEVHTANRLEQGKSTSNVAQMDITEKLRQALKASIPSQDTHTNGD